MERTPKSGRPQSRKEINSGGLEEMTKTRKIFFVTAGVILNTAAKIETGEMRLDVAEMKKFAVIYNKPVDYFLK